MLDRQGYVTACPVEKKSFTIPFRHDPIGRHYSALYDGFQGSPLLDAAMEPDSPGYHASEEAWLRNRGGLRLRVEISIHVLCGADEPLHGFAMIVRDVMPLNTMQDRLRESERRFRLLAQAATEYALCMLDPGGTILDWNLGIQRVTGFTAGTTIGKSVSMLFYPVEESRGVSIHVLHQATQTGRASMDCELVRANEESYLAHVAMEAVHEGDGSLLGFAYIIHDLTGQKHVERRLHEARAHVVHAQKIEAMGQLTGGIAHDFNNALQGITSSLELTLSCLDRQQTGQARHHVMISLDAALRAGRLTQRLLSLARRRRASDRHVSITELLRSMHELLARTLGDGVDLDVVMPDELPPLACDSAQLESALVNLAVNARDAVSGHGRIVIRSRVCRYDDDDIQITLNPACKAYLEIAVIDDGLGMSEDTRRRVLEPFFTTKPEGHGTGLGLSMVHDFVTQHGGAIDIRSMLGSGTSVLLYLPCEDIVPTAPPPPAPKLVPDLSGYRVMVAEDNETIRNAVATQLRQLGCTVLEAASGQEALSILAAHPYWDLLLSDIDLPLLDGYSLCYQARKQFPALRVILMTGYTDSQRLALSGAEDYVEALIKPFDMGDLLTKAQLLLQPTH